MGNREFENGSEGFATDSYESVANPSESFLDSFRLSKKLKKRAFFVK